MHISASKLSFSTQTKPIVNDSFTSYNRYDAELILNLTDRTDSHTHKQQNNKPNQPLYPISKTKQTQFGFVSMSTNKDLKIAPGAVVCVESKLRGVISIGSMTVIHPRATIIAEAGPIVIGENNIIEEQACIAHRLSGGEEWDANRILYIGVNNVFEVGCTIHADKIGDHNVFEAKCYVGPSIEVTTGCIIGAGCELFVPEKLQENSVISGSQCTLTIASDKPPAQTLQLEFLSKVLPNYHHLKKASKKHDQQLAT